MLVWPLRTIGMTVSWGQRAAAAPNGSTRSWPLSRSSPIHRTPTRSGSQPQQDAPAASASTTSASGTTPRIRSSTGSTSPSSLGSSVALVGATGSGKSTVARLLARFYDIDAGAIELDGVDVRRLRLHDLRRSVGIVFEDTFLFHDTVAANIAFADPDAPAERIERAAALAGAAEFIDDLPEGYGTLLGERGFCSRAGSGSASPSPGRSSPIPGCWCSTTPRPPSTRPRSTRSAGAGHRDG